MILGTNYFTWLREHWAGFLLWGGGPTYNIALETGGGGGLPMRKGGAFYSIHGHTSPVHSRQLGKKMAV